MKSGRAVIISNGRVREKEFFIKLIKSTDYVIAVNGGSKHARAFNLIPRVIIGDLDSINKDDYAYFLRNGCEFKQYPKTKDKTDIHLAVDYAIEKGFEEILLLCVFGDRIDHVLANIFLLPKIAEAGIGVQIVDEFSQIVCIDKSGIIRGKIGEVVSLIPLSPIATGVKLDGLKFQPKNGTLKMSNTLGISNILTKQTAKIKIETGKLLVIKPNLLGH